YDSTLDKFQGEILHNTSFEAGTIIKQCPLNHHNAKVIREMFEFTRPVLIGLQSSIGLGDRLGLANPAHLRAVEGTNMKPILAQQSVRELERTERKPEEVMDAATWAVFQEGYRGGFGSDADHLKTTQDIDSMVAAGFTMFTFDPGAYVVNEAGSLPLNDLIDKAKSQDWALLKDTFEKFISRYENKHFTISEDFSIQPSREQVLRALVKYGGVIAHTVKMYSYFRKRYPDYVSEFELSVDETHSPTSHFEHLLIANELKRLGISLVSLAPRFVGDFEKGIDYKGDLEHFKEDYLKHIEIAEAFGPYKISIHSGSDKFSVYDVIASVAHGHVHVKTAGTSYLEALRTIAAKAPALFREILDFARQHFQTEKETYHVSAEMQKVPSSKHFSDDQLGELLDQNDARQVLHVTFGKVLTSKDENGEYIFRKRIMDCLAKYEDSHYAYLVQHFRRHLHAFS
ncbi:MAG: tagaturonate epimerase family protein, partial [bacterium]